MLKKMVVPLCVFALTLGAISCQKLDREESVEGALPAATAKFQDAVPLEYGELVAVSLHPTARQWAALWFQKPDKTIVVVWLNLSKGRVQVQEPVIAIPRR